MSKNAKYYPSLEAAMEALPVSVENRAAVRNIIPRGRAEFWIPAKSTYIAVRPEGEKRVRQYVNKYFVDRRVAPGTYERTEIHDGVAGEPFLNTTVLGDSDAVLLHNQSFTGAAAAREFVENFPPDAPEEWFWNVWQRRQLPYGDLVDGSLVGLVVSWPGHKEVAFLVRAHHVLKGEFAGWKEATNAIADHTSLHPKYVRSEPYTAEKRAGDGGFVIAWKARILRSLDVAMPHDVRLGRNGWTSVAATEIVRWGLQPEPEPSQQSGRGGGVIFDAEAKSRVERHAIEMVLAWCAEQGWQDIEDVGDLWIDGVRCSFDIRGLDDGVQRRIEVKGTTGALGAVTVTRKEVETAAGDKDHLFAIVHGITLGLDTGGAIEATGGTLVVHDPWLPVAEELNPISYRWERSWSADGQTR